LDKELTSIGWTRCSADSCLYVMRRKGKLMILAVYVDDLLLLGDDPAAIRRMKTLLGRYFKIKDLGEVKQIWRWRFRETAANISCLCLRADTSGRSIAILVKQGQIRAQNQHLHHLALLCT